MSVVQKYFDSLEAAETTGLQLLRYLKEDEENVQDSCHKLHLLRTWLRETTNTAKTVRFATKLDQVQSTMMHQFVEKLTADVVDVDPAHEPEIDSARQVRVNKLARALDAKQKRAPGFDGQGGGRKKGAK